MYSCKFAAYFQNTLLQEHLRRDASVASTLLKSGYLPYSFLPMVSCSHMDSSLSWDSVLLKDLAFCIGILTETLVADGFPEDFLESNDTLLTEIRLDLKVSESMHS